MRVPNALRPLVRPCLRTTLAAAVLAAVAGCAGTTMLLESDVPLPEGMSTVRSADIRRAGGTVTSGRFVLAGGIDDASRRLAATISRFESAGWRLESADRGLDHSAATFRKDDRMVRLVLDRRTLDPDMSSGLLEVSSAGPPAPPAADAGGGGAAAEGAASPGARPADAAATQGADDPGAATRPRA